MLSWGEPSVWHSRFEHDHHATGMCGSDNAVCLDCRGVFTVSGLVDAFIYHGSQVIRKKIEIGKLA